MSVRLILPPAYKCVEPVVFLGGPVRETYNWRGSAIERITRAAPGLYVVSPQWPECPGQDESRLWETHYMNWIGAERSRGAFLFYFSRPNEGYNLSTYAKRSIEELEYIGVLHELSNARLIVGVEDGFPKKDIVSSILSRYQDIDIQTSLEDICSKAVKNIRING